MLNLVARSPRRAPDLRFGSQNSGFTVQGPRFMVYGLGV